MAPARKKSNTRNRRSLGLSTTRASKTQEMKHGHQRRPYALHALEPRILLSGTEVAVASPQPEVAIVAVIEVEENSADESIGAAISFDADAQVASIFDTEFGSEESEA